MAWRARALWLRWVAANSLAELLGLGATFSVGFLIVAGLGEPQTFLAAAGSILLMTCSGFLEGAVVGLLQWAVLRKPFPGVSCRSWLVATLVGALVAWFLGSLPTTLMGFGGEEAGAAAQEPAAWMVLLLAAAMGLVLGLVLAYPQWKALRPAARYTWVWMPANSAAWALGMPLIFAAVDLANKVGTVGGAIGTMALALALTGAIVGAVHGLALVWLASKVHSEASAP